MKTRVALIALAAVLCAMFAATPAFSQYDAVRAAIAQQDYIGALRLLSVVSADETTADTYLYRGIAYANLHQFKRALDVFTEGANRYPNDPRFHNEGLALFRPALEIVEARNQLREALLANPTDIYALALLASLDLSDGSIELALRALNRESQPKIDRILDNYSLTFSSPVISSVLAFHSGQVLNYRDWKTTEARLNATNAFSSVALEIEPANEGGQFNANIRMTKKTNTLPDFAVGLLKGLPVSTTFFDFWNIAGSYAQFNSSYRWDASRRRAEGELSDPLPMFHLFFVDFDTLWRSELWENPSGTQFRYKASEFRVGVKHITDRRIEIGAGLEYESRAPVPDVGKMLFHVQYRPLDGRIKSQVRFDGFGARASLWSESTYAGGTVSLANRLVLSEGHGTYFDFSIKGGVMRGQPAIEDYFILGVDNESDYLLRGHNAFVGGVYGRSPMGTDFVLLNNTFDRRITTILKSPISAELFTDLAKVFDRNHIYTQEGWLLDVGAGAKIRIQDTDISGLYGRSLTTGSGVFSAYIERRFW